MWAFLATVTSASGGGCPGPKPRLATRTPEQVPSGQHLGANLRTADIAGLTVPSIDVHLAAVVIDTRRAGHRLWRVLQVDGVDAAGAHAFMHQRDEVVPHRLEAASTQRVAGTQRVQPAPEQNLRAVNVSDACEHRLVHQQRADGGARPAHTAPGPIPVRV